ncbi:U3-containing 90S pre-ribosomal complex subunit-domain containing protein, partial [Lobosporangium transversale]
LGKRPHASQFEILNDSQKQALENLSSFELEERRIPESSIKDTSRFALDHTLVHLESFLKFANKKPLETSKDLPKGSPVVLIVSASGIRSVDVIRALPLFTEAAKVGKLFAKHFKVPEQVNFLKNTCTHICVGTPNRIDKLISDGALHLDRLELVLLDCHKDAKRRTLLDIHEIRVDLFKMLGLKVLDERIRSGLTKIALF